MTSLSQTVLITGSAKRAGLQIAQFFAKKGYQIAIHYAQSSKDALQAQKDIEQYGAKVHLFQADLTQAENIHQLIEAVYLTFGRLDCLINNASVFWQDHFNSFTLEQFDQAWAINARTPILLTRAFYEQAKQRQETGVVINIIDQKIQNNFHPDHFSYTVAKTALGNLTQMLALSCQPILRINAVYPGLMLPSDDQTDADFQYASQHATPLKCIATPENLAQAIYLLVKDDYNGVDFTVDAGQNLIKVQQDILYSHRAPNQ